jgi:hypothetical protein
MKKVFLILACCGLFFQIFAQKKIDFNSIDRIEMYYLTEEAYFDVEYLNNTTKINAEIEYPSYKKYSCTLPDSVTVDLLQLVKAAFFEDSPTQGEKSDGITTSMPVVGITCYAKGKKVYSNRICHEIDYRFSPAYTKLIDRLLCIVTQHQE